MAAATTERRPTVAGERPLRGRGAGRSGLDRGSVFLFSLAAFLVVLALLANDLRPSASTAPPQRVIVIRRIYRTTIIEKDPGSARGTSVSQSVSSSGSSNAYAAAPTTRSSPSH